MQISSTFRAWFFVMVSDIDENDNFETTLQKGIDMLNDHLNDEQNNCELFLKEDKNEEKKIKYEIEDNLDDILVRASYQTKPSQTKTWSTNYNEKNFREKIPNLKFGSQWPQVRGVILGIFNKEYEAIFSEELNSEVMKIECKNKVVENFFG